MMRRTVVLFAIWAVILSVCFPHVLVGNEGSSDPARFPDPAVGRWLNRTAEDERPDKRRIDPRTRLDADALSGREEPSSNTDFVKDGRRGLQGSPTDTLYLNGNEDYSHGPCWTPYGDHAMRGIGQCFVYYYFDLSTVCLSEGSLEIGVEFASWSEEASVLGPNLWVWSHTGEEWVSIATAMGDQDEIIWKWFVLPAPSDQWVSSGGLVTICVESVADDEVIVDEVGAALDPIYPDLTIPAVWVEPPGFCQADSVGMGFVVKNVGSCKVIHEFYCDLWLDAFWLGFVLLDSLGVDDSLTVVLHDLNWPDDTDPHSLYGMADTDGFVKESDETNNVKFADISAKPKPPVPSNVRATDGDHLDRVEISWDSASGATAYTIYREETLLATDWPGTTYDDFGATPQEVHTYKVYACNECGCSSEFGSDSGHIGAVPVSIPMTSGWDYFSLNVESDDMSLDSVLLSLGEAGSYIKDQTSFSEYVPEWSGWFGTLQYLTCESTYMIRMNEAGTLAYTGYQYDRSTPMPLASGWNWISYLPTLPMSLDDALASLEDNGTYIKNQTSFSEYVPEWSGWFGTLAEMRPNDGFKIKMATSDILIYPEPPALAENSGGWHNPSRLGHACMADWATVPADYEFSGSVTATVAASGVTTISSGDILAAFVDGECRGLQSAIAAPNREYVFCLMVYSNAMQGEILSFRYYDSSKGMVYDVIETLGFSANMTRGQVISPLRMAARPVARDPEIITPLENALHRSYPNPFNTQTTIGFSISRSGHVAVEVFNIKGKKVRILVDNDLAPGRYNVVWDRKNQSAEAVSSGFYFCRMKTEGYVSIEKMTLLE